MFPARSSVTRCMFRLLFLGAVLAMSLGSAPAGVIGATAAPFCPAGNGLFAIYYGAITNPASTDAALQAIGSQHPNFVIVGSGQAGRSDIPTALHQYGALAIEYVALDYGNGDATTIDTTVNTAMQNGYDGIFFDQASTDDSANAFQQARAANVKQDDPNGLVIMNPGQVPQDAS